MYVLSNVMRREKFVESRVLEKSIAILDETCILHECNFYTQVDTYSISLHQKKNK